MSESNELSAPAEDDTSAEPMASPEPDPTALPIFADRVRGSRTGTHSAAASPVGASSAVTPAAWSAASSSPADQVAPPTRPTASALAGPLLHRPQNPTSPPSVGAHASPPAPTPAPTGLSASTGYTQPPAAATGLHTPIQSVDEPSAPREGQVDLDWQQVALLRVQASHQLTARLGAERGMDLDSEREMGRALIQELLASTVADRLHDGQLGWSEDEQDALAEAVFDALFGLGRLQPLVDDDSVENIIIAGGAENVWVDRIDGSLTKVAPVADSDEELLEFLAYVASRSEVNARNFSFDQPALHLRLDGGHRLAAVAWVTARPSVVIRRHRLLRVSLTDLVDRGMLTALQAGFLRAAVKAGKSIVVAGPQGAGKTTTVRALAAEIPPWEAIGTFETEFELHLHDLKDVHPVVHAWEARPGSGETGPDGRRAGEFTLSEALADSFRFNLSRQIVGEVRGSEVWTMIKAMESGAGSISTTHATSGTGAIRKLVTCAMEAGPHATRDLVTSKLAETVDLVVQVNVRTTPLGDDTWQRDRWISEIVYIQPGEEVVGYAATPVFKPNPAGGPGIPGTIVDALGEELAAQGFDLDAYLAEGARQETT